jgi:hypothetical protein
VHEGVVFNAQQYTVSPVAITRPIQSERKRCVSVDVFKDWYSKLYFLLDLQVFTLRKKVLQVSQVNLSFNEEMQESLHVWENIQA